MHAGHEDAATGFKDEQQKSSLLLSDDKNSTKIDQKDSSVEISKSKDSSGDSLLVKPSNTTEIKFEESKGDVADLASDSKKLTKKSDTIIIVDNKDEAKDI